MCESYDQFYMFVFLFCIAIVALSTALAALMYSWSLYVQINICK